MEECISTPIPLPTRECLSRKCKCQAAVASLATDKATVQSHAAELEARLAREVGEHRRRAERSRHVRTVSAERLSAAESRASVAEARVEAVVRHLTLSERRLREAEHRAALAVAERVAGREVERGQAVVAGGAGQPTAADDVGGDHAIGGQDAAESSMAQHAATRLHHRSSESEEERYLTRVLPPPPGSVDKNAPDLARPITRDGHHVEDRVLRGINNSARNTNTSHRVDLADASQQEQGNTTPPRKILNTAGRSGKLGMASADNENAVSSPRDADAAPWKVDRSEQENVVLIKDANRAKFETQETPDAVEIGKGSAAAGSERLEQELRLIGKEVMHASFSTA